MWTPILTWLGANYPVLLVIIVIVGLTIICMNVYHHLRNRIIKVENDCVKIDGNILPELNTIDNSLNTLNSSFLNLIAYLKGKDKDMETSLFKSFSPIRLTEAGESVLASLDGKKLVDDNLKELFSAIELHNAKTALDVQNIAAVVIGNISHKDQFKAAKDFVYKHPEYDFTDSAGTVIKIKLDMNSMNNVLGIYLRDKFLEEHPEIVP